MFGCPVKHGGSFDSLFCRHIPSLSPPFGKDLFAEETLRLLDVACATETFNQRERRVAGFTVVFCCSPQSRCPRALPLTCCNKLQLLQTHDQRASVKNGACDTQALSWP